MKKISKKAVIDLSIVISLFCIATIIFPQLRLQIVYFIENLTARNLNDEFCVSFLFIAAKIGLFAIVPFNLFFFTNFGRKLYLETALENKKIIKIFASKTMLIWVAVVFFIYLLGIYTIIRANIYYEDDLRRSIIGERGWLSWSRYISEFLSILVHMDEQLTDISPLPQIIALFVLAVATVIFVYVLNNKKISFLPIVAALPIGFSPFFLQNLSYKFDSPYMALSILFSMIPFLFIENRKVFILSSILGILGVCMTYQASSGIYIIFVLIIAFSQWIKGKKLKEIGSFIITATLSFIVTLLVFRLIFMYSWDVYVSTNMLSMVNFFSGILANAKSYILVLWEDLGRGTIKIFGLIICVLFLFISAKKTKHNKLLTFIISLFILFMMLVLSYGVYLALEHPLWKPRAFCGFGIFIAAVSVYCITMWDQLEKSLLNVTTGLSVIFLSYSMMVFAFSYGNALADEKRYAEFRTTLMISDLIRYIDISQKPSIQIAGSIGYTPTIKNIGEIYPLIYKLVHVPLSYEYWGPHYLKYYNFDYNISDNDFSSSDLPLLSENSYHIIKGEPEAGLFLVLLKE